MNVLRDDTGDSKPLASDERGVSAVVGTVLLVAVVVVLMAVVGLAVADLADNAAEPRPVADVEFAFDEERGLTVIHMAGSRMAAPALGLEVDDPDGEVTVRRWGAVGSVAPGSERLIEGVTGNERVRLVWRSDRSSALLAEWTGPRRGAVSDGSDDADAGGDSGGSDDPDDSDDSGGVSDPGHAYEDRDQSGTFDPDVDRRITAEELRDGYTVADGGLVVPPSVGTIRSPDGATFEGDGIVFAATIENPNSGVLNGVRFDARDGDLRLHGATVDSQRDQGRVELVAGGRILATDASVTSNGDVSVSSGGTTDLRRTTMRTIKRDASVSLSSAGDIDLTAATLDANSANPGPGNRLRATVGDDAVVVVTDARFRSVDNTLTVTPTGAATGEPESGRVG